jgi:hypothetical protein
VLLGHMARPLPTDRDHPGGAGVGAAALESLDPSDSEGVSHFQGALYSTAYHRERCQLPKCPGREMSAR